MSTRTSRKVTYVTCGTAGVGHLVRGLAVGRALARAGVDVDYEIISPKAPLPAMGPALSGFEVTVCDVDAAKVLDPAAAPTTPLADALRASKPDLLVVDLFWAPLLHLRALVDCDAWLIVRSCPPIWLVGNDKVRFDRDQYQRVIGIEPVEHDEIREHIEPLVVCNRDENKTRAEFCDHFDLDPGRPIVAFSHAGLKGEIEALKAAPDDDRLQIIKCDLHDHDAVFPLAPWLAEIDSVHCSAGYNTFWEAHWLGFAERTTFSVFRRSIDDPLWRVKANRGREMSANGADVLAEMIARG